MSADAALHAALRLGPRRLPVEIQDMRERTTCVKKEDRCRTENTREREDIRENEGTLGKLI